jgi:hypothetical protein
MFSQECLIRRDENVELELRLSTRCASLEYLVLPNDVSGSSVSVVWHRANIRGPRLELSCPLSTCMVNTGPLSIPQLCHLRSKWCCWVQE